WATPEGATASWSGIMPAQPLISAVSPATRLLTARRAIEPIADQHGLRDRIVAVVRERHEDAIAAPGAGDRAAGAAQHHRGRSAPLAPHLELAPGDAHREPGAQRLERRLLRCEPCRQVGNGIPAPTAVGDLLVREHAAEEALAPALHDAAHAR